MIIIIMALLFLMMFVLVFDELWINLLPKPIFFDACHGYREKDNEVRNDK